MDARASSGYASILYQSYLKRKSVPLTFNAVAEPENTSGDMKYLQVFNIAAGTTMVATTLTYEQDPYNIYLLDSDGNDITASVTIKNTFSGGVWNLEIYSASALSDVKLKIIY